MIIYANPTSGWYEDSGDTNPWVLLLLPAIFLVPYLIGEIIDLFKSKPKSNVIENTESETDIIENELDLEDGIEKAKEQMLKGFNPASVEKNEHREFNNIDNIKPINSREYFYVSIIIILLVALYSLYTQYQNDSYTRVMNCFKDEVKEPKFCQAFYKQYTQKNLISAEKAEEVILDCWDERLLYCKEESLGDECTFGTMAYCKAKHPEHDKVYVKRFDKD